MSLALLLGTELRAATASGLDVYGLSAPGTWLEHVAELGITHVPLPALTRAWDPRRDLAAARELADVLRRIRPDILHTHNPKTGVLGRVLGRALGVPVVVNTCHGLWVREGDGRARTLFVLGMESLAAQCSHAELFQNAADREALRHVVAARRARVVGNGIDLARFRFDASARARLRAELDVEPDEILVGGVGRRVAEKGIAEYAAAARALAGKARFVWVGPQDGDKPDAQRDDESGVTFLGERRDMPAIYSALDVFVLPSHREGFSRSGMEAAACGVAAVLSDIRGCREVGEHERELLLVPPGDVAALTAAISRLILQPDLRHRLGEAARRRAGAEFDQLAVTRVSLETYAAVARRRGLGWTVQR
jgi:glycosyltransferase involved in cell wall biosynthesis